MAVPAGQGDCAEGAADEEDEEGPAKPAPAKACKTVQHYRVIVPSNVLPGQNFVASADGQLLEISCPWNASAGTPLVIETEASSAHDSKAVRDQEQRDAIGRLFGVLSSLVPSTSPSDSRVMLLSKTVDLIGELTGASAHAWSPKRNGQLELVASYQLHSTPDAGGRHKDGQGEVLRATTLRGLQTPRMPPEGSEGFTATALTSVSPASREGMCSRSYIRAGEIAPEP
jgi:hypothetical protein